ncbi:MAG: type IV toxin-antitoxin system AbiEi family antitoxin domain-containing protein [Candidatus Omnitrophota bacterium]
MSYERLRKIKKLYFGYEEISRILGISPESAKVTAARFTKRGILIRLKRNFYVLAEKWDYLSKEKFFELANIIQVPSYISLMSAMDYYNLTTQIQRVFFESIVFKRTKEFNVNNMCFNYTKISKKLYFGFKKYKGFFIAEPEKAFLDAVYLMLLGRYHFDLTSMDLGKLDVYKLKKLAKEFPLNIEGWLKKNGYIK